MDFRTFLRLTERWGGRKIMAKKVNIFLNWKSQHSQETKLLMFEFLFFKIQSLDEKFGLSAVYHIWCLIFWILWKESIVDPFDKSKNFVIYNVYIQIPWTYANIKWKQVLFLKCSWVLNWHYSFSSPLFLDGFNENHPRTRNLLSLAQRVAICTQWECGVFLLFSSIFFIKKKLNCRYIYQDLVYLQQRSSFIISRSSKNPK